MNLLPDEATIRQFITIIATHAAQLTNGASRTGVLQLCRISPADDKEVIPTRFIIGDIERMVEVAVGDAASGYNIYIEGRAVRSDLRAGKRGYIEDTTFVFALVADCDADKGKGGNITTRPSLAVETSPGNYHLWYLLTRAVPAEQARKIGDAIRASSGADQDTGVVTQCYRVPGTPNFPNTAKRARGRVTVEPTRILEHTGRLWDPDELLAAFSNTAPQQNPQSTASNGGILDADEVTLPDDLLQAVRAGVAVGKRSSVFHSVVAQLRRRNWTVEAIITLFEKYPNGIASKFITRRPDAFHREVRRSFDKAGKAAQPAVGAIPAGLGTASGATTAPGGAPIGAASPMGGTATAATPHVIPTIRLVNGQLPRIVDETEQALLNSGLPVFSRAGELVEPVSETMTAADGRKTVVARLRTFSPDSLLEPIAKAAIFQRFKRNAWADADPPVQVVRMVLARERSWTIPRVSGVITTPTLRSDGSLLAMPGYDSRSELYLLLTGLQVPPIPEHPTREQAQAALKTLTGLFAEFTFKDKQSDRAVALSGLLTALVRGALPTAPVHLVRADTPGTGKSYLVDLITMVATGRICPVITTSKNQEETEKRIGSILLSGTPVVSLDNCVHDLGGELMCQLTERPVVKIRILGRSEMPDCECRTAVFATGNNIGFRGDMVRRGLMCALEALDERPELRAYQKDVLEEVAANRGVYVAAALTVIRAYLTAGAPKVCGPFGSYAAWSRMVRSPLVWLGEPDPIASMDAVRGEDPELSDIRELFDLWLAYELGLDTPYTSARIIEIACAPPSPNDFNVPEFKLFLTRVAGDKTGISATLLGRWLRKISGRVVSGHRLVKMATTIGGRAQFRLHKVT